MLPNKASLPSIATGVRDPEATRERLLICAFEEIYEKGYGGASLDQILADSGVTKGALYHHFGSKADLAVAIIDEIVLPFMLEQWVSPLKSADDPITALAKAARQNLKMAGEQYMHFGCPLNNLAQELAATDELFRTHINAAFEAWTQGIAEAFAHGQVVGTVRDDADPTAIGAFVVASIEGFATMMKSSRDMALVDSASAVLFQFLESLRPSTAESAA